MTFSITTRRDTHGRVEKAATYSVEGPHIDEQGEAICEGEDHDCQAARAARCGRAWSLAHGHQVAGIAEPEEKECAHELARRSNPVRLDGGEVGASLCGAEVSVRIVGIFHSFRRHVGRCFEALLREKEKQNEGRLVN